jgi:hypothetical protein
VVRRRSPKLGRRPYKREPKRTFYIFCEGRRTEPEYFSALKRRYSNTLIRISAVGACGDPAQVVAKAKSKLDSLPKSQKFEKVSSFEEGDEVWAIFDRDEHDRSRFEDAVKACLQSDIGLGLSNPCFELWLALHEEDFNKLMNSSQMQKYYKRRRPEYNENSGKCPNFDEIIDRLEKAEERAERMLEQRKKEGDENGLPSTTVGRLTFRIRDASSKSGR